METFFPNNFERCVMSSWFAFPPAACCFKKIVTLSSVFRIRNEPLPGRTRTVNSKPKGTRLYHMHGTAGIRTQVASSRSSNVTKLHHGPGVHSLSTLYLFK